MYRLVLFGIENKFNVNEQKKLKLISRSKHKLPLTGTERLREIAYNSVIRS